jgi:Ni,Fe-hydrogenase maturation factor
VIDQRPKTKDQRPNLNLDFSSSVFGPWSCLVIGYGNDLRGDDGAGPRVAELVRGWRLPGLTAIAVRQLTPELAEPLASAEFALFVDARPPDGTEDVRVEPLAWGPNDNTFQIQDEGSGNHDASKTRTQEATQTIFEPSYLRGYLKGNRPHYGALGHSGDPAALLAFAEVLYGACPAAWLLTLPSASFELGADHSGVAARGVANALELIRAAFAEAALPESLFP